MCSRSAFWVAGLVVGIYAASLLPAQEPATPGMTPPGTKQAVQWKEFDYTCEGSAKLTVYLHNETVRVLFNRQVYRMRQVIAASGTRYSDGQVVWWSKGESGFLQHDSPSGNGEMIVKDCQLNHPLQADGTPNLITGTLSFSGSALPPDSVIQLQLEDVSRADVPATTVAEDKIIWGQHQLPVSFELKFDLATIDPQHTYAIGARIVDGQTLRFINDRVYHVLTHGNPSHVEIILKPVETSKPTEP
jgi:uncharacterized lipoprotein YbaY/membrane-bound inhibitor of C-type lysozyme